MQHSIEDLLKVKAAGSINANVPTPLYYQLYSLLKSLILDGSIGHSQRLPAEGQLAEMFDVSRITAKRAMDELAQDGLIERRRGRGSHVIFRFKSASGSNTFGWGARRDRTYCSTVYCASIGMSCSHATLSN